MVEVLDSFESLRPGHSFCGRQIFLFNEEGEDLRDPQQDPTRMGPGKGEIRLATGSEEVDEDPKEWVGGRREVRVSDGVYRK